MKALIIAGPGAEAEVVERLITTVRGLHATGVLDPCAMSSLKPKRA
jgi:hypothetical protein